jgi:amino acid transporter
MSRDDALPASKWLSKVNTDLHTPIWSCIAIGILAFIPMLQFAGAGIVAIAATGMIYLSYLIGNIALLRARLSGWPKSKAPFSLGRWGLPLTLAALAWGGGMLVNFAWPRIQSNPKPSQLLDANGHLQLNFGWHWLNDQPVFWTVVVIIALVGALYFVLVQRNKPAHMEAPEGEAMELPAPVQI